MSHSAGELTLDALQSSNFLIWPEKPRDCIVLFTRLLLLVCLIASIAVVVYATFTTDSYFRLPSPKQNTVIRHQSKEPTNISHILFCIGGAAQSWRDRSRYVSLWWRPNATRGVVWLDEKLSNGKSKKGEDWISVRVSDPGWTKFKYSSSRSAVRIARIIWDSFKLRLPDVRWFVMGDDDTVYFPDNLVSVLAKYDHNQMWYIGGNSESVEQDEMHSYEMAFGGGGFAVSYPLAERLVGELDGCLGRYYYFYGSDERIAACISEIGVPLTRELGFHQLDIRGDPYGLLAAHPVAPLVSLHHLEYLEPIIPNNTQIGSMEILMKAYRADPKRILQQTFCYDHKRKWSISISWGYTVQIYTTLLAAKDMKIPLRTFKTWRSWSDGPFTFNTRPENPNACERPVLYFLDQVQEVSVSGIRSSYNITAKPIQKCDKTEHGRAMAVQRIIISSMKMDPDYWTKAPRRQCCEVLDDRGVKDRSSLRIRVRQCRARDNVYF